MIKKVLIGKEGNHLINPQQVICERETYGDKVEDGVHGEGGVGGGRSVDHEGGGGDDQKPMRGEGEG